VDHGQLANDSVTADPQVPTAPVPSQPMDLLDMLGDAPPQEFKEEKPEETLTVDDLL